MGHGKLRWIGNILVLWSIKVPYFVSYVKTWLNTKNHLQRLHTENQLPRLYRTAVIVMIPGVVMVVVGFLPIIIPTQQKLF